MLAGVVVIFFMCIIMIMVVEVLEMVICNEDTVVVVEGEGMHEESGGVMMVMLVDIERLAHPIKTSGKGRAYSVKAAKVEGEKHPVLVRIQVPGLPLLPPALLPYRTTHYQHFHTTVRPPIRHLIRRALLSRRVRMAITRMARRRRIIRPHRHRGRQ
jgi:hypothetical protein